MAKRAVLTKPAKKTANQLRIAKRDKAVKAAVKRKTRPPKFEVGQILISNDKSVRRVIAGLEGDQVHMYELVRGSLGWSYTTSSRYVRKRYIQTGDYMRVLNGGARPQDGYRFWLFGTKKGPVLRTGCRIFTSLAQALYHWKIVQDSPFNTSRQEKNEWAIKTATDLWIKAVQDSWIKA